MKTKLLLYILLVAFSPCLFADSATVVVQVFPADSGKYSLMDKLTESGMLIHDSGTFDKPIIKITCTWPAGNPDSMILCVFFCKVFVNGEVSINIPVLLERNKTVKVLLECAAFNEEEEVNKKFRTTYFGTQHARDFNLLWNSLLDQMTWQMKAAQDHAGDSLISKIQMNKMDLIRSYKNRYPQSGFWKMFLWYELLSERDTLYRKGLLSIVPDGLCKNNETPNYPDKLLCKEVNKNPVPNRRLEYELNDVLEKRHTSKKEKGKIIFVDFWATWCRPCKMEQAELKKMFSELRVYKKFQMVSISIDKDKGKWKNYLQDHPTEWLHLIDDDHAVSKKYDVESVPYNMIVDESGKIIFQHLDLAEAKAELLKLLRED